MANFLPPEFWTSGLTQPSIPFNDNFLRFLISQTNVNNATTAQPVSPTDGDTYIIQSTHTGAQWATFSPKDLAIYYGGTWYNYTPSEGNTVSVSGVRYIYTSGAWAAAGGGSSTQGKQVIAITAGAMRPSLTTGSALLAVVNMGSNQPDIATLDFDPTTEEYAQFSIPMPKKWNAGTITARFRWSHAATTTNFGVVWACQALAVSDDDTIAASFGTAQTVTDTGGTTNDLYISSETSAITVGGSPSKGDTVFFRIYRVAANGSDTLAIDARLHGVDIFVTTDADTDA